MASHGKPWQATTFMMALGHWALSTCLNQVSQSPQQVNHLRPLPSRREDMQHGVVTCQIPIWVTSCKKCLQHRMMLKYVKMSVNIWDDLLSFGLLHYSTVILFKFRSQPRSFFCQSQSQFPLCFARGEQCTPRSLAFWTRVDKECHLQAFNPAQQINLYSLEYKENWKTREVRKSTYRSFFSVFFCHLGICPPFRPSRHCICKNVALHIKNFHTPGRTSSLAASRSKESVKGHCARHALMIAP